MVWGDTLVDGHNRYAICTKHGIAFSTVTKEFDSREDAIEWIINNQFGRRNLTDYQRGVLALRLKPIMEARARAKQLSTLAQNSTVSPNSDERTTPIRTDAAVASLANLGKDTIRKIETIEREGAPDVKALAGSGDVSIHLASQFIELPPEIQQEALAAIAQHDEPAKEVMREAIHNHRAQGTGENECLDFSCGHRRKIGIKKPHCWGVLI